MLKDLLTWRITGTASPDGAAATKPNSPSQAEPPPKKPRAKTARRSRWLFPTHTAAELAYEQQYRELLACQAALAELAPLEGMPWTVEGPLRGMVYGQQRTGGPFALVLRQPDDERLPPRAQAARLVDWQWQADQASPNTPAGKSLKLLVWRLTRQAQLEWTPHPWSPGEVPGLSPVGRPIA